MSELFKQLVRERIQLEENFVSDLEAQMKEMDEYTRKISGLEMVQMVFLMGDAEILIDASKREIARFEKILQGESDHA
jgi:hypothetical protein